MILPIGSRHFKAEETKQFYALLEKFPTAEDVCFTAELKELLDIVISIIVVKKGWLDPRGCQRDCDDLIQTIYLNAHKICRNVWKRMKDPANPIRSLYSYLCRAVESRGWDFIRSQDHNLDHYAEIGDFLDKRQSEGQLDGVDPNPFFTNLYDEELISDFRARLNNIQFRVNSYEELLACHWLVRCFVRGSYITIWDLYPFWHFPEDRKEFLFAQVDVRIKIALQPMKDLMNPKKLKLLSPA